MENTGRFILLDSDKCPKCASGKYEDIEVSLNFKEEFILQKIFTFQKSQNGHWPQRYFWESYRAIEFSQNIQIEAEELKKNRMKSEPFLGTKILIF